MAIGNGVRTMAWAAMLLVWLSLFGEVASQQDQVILRYQMDEEQKVGYHVGSVKDDANLGQRYGPSLDQLRFHFLSQPRANFMIEDTTGVIRTSGLVDRDALCPGAVACEVKLDVAIKPVQFFEIIKITVDIMDINDNPPRFPAPSITHDLLESVVPGNSFVVPAAVDPDSPEYGVQRYQLASGGDDFELKLTNKLDGSLSVKLQLKHALNRETQDEYKVQIVAFDGGTPPNSGSIEVTVNVLDSNDNPPVFTNTTYSVSVTENVNIFTTIVRVHASDEDIGENGQVEYEFSQQTRDLYGHLFGLDATTGDIYVQGKIDYEKAEIYTLAVVAKDRGADSVPAEAVVVVSVRDVNDHAPDITVNTLTASDTAMATVAEGEPPGTFVAHVTVRDRDAGDNGRFNCSLTMADSPLGSVPPFALSPLYDSGEYKIVTRSRLDREAAPAGQRLVVTCRDHGAEPQVSVKKISVSILDVNDCAPVFSQQAYYADVIENNYVGAVVSTQISASDCDTGENSALQYSIPREMSKLFEIDPISGVLRAKTSFDKESLSQVRFSVFAADGGTPSRTSTAVVVVAIQDVNDEAPTFSRDSYSFSVDENSPAGTSVGAVAATDRDSPPYNQFRFSLLEAADSTAATAMFRIAPESGELTTAAVLDRERAPVYYLTVVAMDTDGSSLSSSVTATVYVTDKNDNAPTFTFPSATNSSVAVSARAPVGTVVARVAATDADLGNNAKVTFHVHSGATPLFSLDPVSGAVSVNQPLGGSDRLLSLTISAKDHGFPQKESLATLTLSINASLPFPLASVASAASVLSGENFVIVVSLAVASAVVTAILVAAIVLIRRSDRRRNATPGGKTAAGHKYNCRMEALKMLTSNGDNNSVVETPLPRKPAPTTTLANGSGPHSGHNVGTEKAKKEVSFSLDTPADSGSSSSSRIQKIPPPPAWGASVSTATAPPQHGVSTSTAHSILAVARPNRSSTLVPGSTFRQPPDFPGSQCNSGLSSFRPPPPARDHNALTVRAPSGDHNALQSAGGHNAAADTASLPYWAPVKVRRKDSCGVYVY